MCMRCFAGYEPAPLGLGPFYEPTGFDGVPVLPGLGVLGSIYEPSGLCASGPASWGSAELGGYYEPSG